MCYNLGMLIAILGRQPELSIAELESYFGADKIHFSNRILALIDAETANIDHFGGCLKIAKIDFTLPTLDFSRTTSEIIKFYSQKWQQLDGKITLGISYYDQRVKPRQVQQIGLQLKQHLRSVRLIPNQAATLTTAVAHHNKLGSSDKKVELVVVNLNQQTLIGHSLGAQNITAYVKRDRQRPKRDARVGMLPPKLAQILVNLSRPTPFTSEKNYRLLDPFCGTGVVLQEAHLLGFQIAGSDLEPRMIEYTKTNLSWLDQTSQVDLTVGDATNHVWNKPINCIASETYLGYPFKTIQSTHTIDLEANKIEHLLTAFLKNLHDQTTAKTRLCLAVPAWLQAGGRYRDLELIKPIHLKRLGFQLVKFEHVNARDLLYHRQDQIVARRILVLERI